MLSVLPVFLLRLEGLFVMIVHHTIPRLVCCVHIFENDYVSSAPQAKVLEEERLWLCR